MENKTEYRFLQNSELRTAGAGKIRGYAACFGVPSLPLGRSGYTEKIRRGAFAQSMTADVIALYDHNPANLLARTTAGTMTLEEDSTGLKTEINLPPTQLGRDTYALVQRGDLRGMSFGFNVTRDTWNPAHTERELLGIDLHEISIVARPAYPQTSIEARSLGLPAGVEVLVYAGVIPTPVSDEERERLRLRLELLQRL
jgi:HK97 family phage prohead protease